MSENPKKPSNFKWLKIGLFWTVITVSIVEIALPYAKRETIQWEDLWINVLVWLGVGLIFGLSAENPFRKKDTAGNPTD
jgi:hypothetical protein